ncbi:uncharacterized protein LOC143276194 [Babylonia areolata]|uniref:uncharacterized protein LOC143276194 n=1 Tax=Babylonia areolata TaxID=304850 RepID=UPI003FD298C6
MVSKRGKRKRSVEGASSGEQKQRKRELVDSTSAGDENPTEQTDGCEGNSHTESQDTCDMAVDSTENTNTLAPPQPSDHEDKPTDQPGPCDDGDASKSTKDTHAPEDTNCQTSSAPDKAAEESVPHEAVSEEAGPCDSEIDKTLTADDAQCDMSAETVKADEQLAEGSQLGGAKLKTKEPFPEEKHNESHDKSNQEIPKKIPESLPPTNEDSISTSTDLNKTENDTSDSTKHVTPKVKEKEIYTKGEGQEKELKPSSANEQDNQHHTCVTMIKETAKETRDITQEPESSTKVNNLAEINPTDEVNARTATETANQQTTPTEPLAAEDQKLAESEQILKEVLNKAHLPQPNQAGDFLDTPTLGKASVLSESGPENKKKVDQLHEVELQKEGLKVEEKHANLADKDRGNKIAECGEEFAEQFDLPGSQEVKERMLMTSQGDNSSCGNNRMGRE